MQMQQITYTGLKRWSKNLSKPNKLIYNSNWVLLLVDGLEEQRPLSTLEKRFRKLVKAHLADLLESKRLYWRQRSALRWVSLGDENTHFFHIVATIAHKRNFIVSLAHSDGNLITEHEQKENLLWTAFKSRLGVSEFQNVYYDLDSLLLEQNLNLLDDDFSQDEINAVIKNLPNSHAPGPDGFNGLFIKKCLDILKGDFLRLLSDFCSHNISLKSINSSVIALIPKKDNLACVDDYRPISLLNFELLFEMHHKATLYQVAVSHT